MHRRLRRGALAVSAVALVAIAGAVTYAVADIGGGGVINGCYKSQNGQLRVIDPATDSCLPSETAISWSQTGPQGPPGPTGATGATGPQGPTGPRGPGTKTISGIVSSDGGTLAGTGFSVQRAAVGQYLVRFPAGTWNVYPAWPVMVVTSRGGGLSGGIHIANVDTFSTGSDGSAAFVVVISSTAGAITPVDAGFLFTATAPLTAGSSAASSSTAKVTNHAVRRSTLLRRKRH